MATTYTLQRLYSPSKKYESILSLWDHIDDLTDEAYFRLLICDVLISSKDYNEIATLNIPESIDNQIAQQIIEEEVTKFLDHCDDLPAFPTKSDCLKQLNAPSDLLEKYVAQYTEQNIFSLLPHTKNDSLTILFEERLKELYEEVKQKNKNGYYLKKVSLADLQQIFSIIADNREKVSELFDDDILIEEVKVFFKAEFSLVYKYENAVANSKSKDWGFVFDTIKKNTFTQVEAIIHILEIYFK